MCIEVVVVGRQLRGDLAGNDKGRVRKVLDREKESESEKGE